MTVAIQVSGRTSCLTSSPLVLNTIKYSINQFELLEVVDEPCVEWISFKLFFRWLSVFLYLTYILTSAKLDAAGHRWIDALTSYNFNSMYISGSSNAYADGLSRLPVEVVMVLFSDSPFQIKEF
jgi:hypothetical protein